MALEPWSSRPETSMSTTDASTAPSSRRLSPRCPTRSVAITSSASNWVPLCYGTWQAPRRTRVTSPRPTELGFVGRTMLTPPPDFADDVTCTSPSLGNLKTPRHPTPAMDAPWSGLRSARCDPSDQELATRPTGRSSTAAATNPAESQPRTTDGPANAITRRGFVTNPAKPSKQDGASRMLKAALLDAVDTLTGTTQTRAVEVVMSMSGRVDTGPAVIDIRSVLSISHQVALPAGTRHRPPLTTPRKQECPTHALPETECGKRHRVLTRADAQRLAWRSTHTQHRCAHFFNHHAGFAGTSRRSAQSTTRRVPPAANPYHDTRNAETLRHCLGILVRSGGGI